jgi:hypothetical protein
MPVGWDVWDLCVGPLIRKHSYELQRREELEDAYQYRYVDPVTGRVRHPSFTCRPDLAEVDTFTTSPDYDEVDFFDEGVFSASPSSGSCSSASSEVVERERERVSSSTSVNKIHGHHHTLPMKAKLGAVLSWSPSDGDHHHPPGRFKRRLRELKSRTQQPRLKPSKSLPEISSPMPLDDASRQVTNTPKKLNVPRGKLGIAPPRVGPPGG